MKLRSRPFAVLMVMVAAAVFFLTVPALGEVRCQAGTGTTVVVDFASFGGQVRVACASGSPGSGFEALSAAGFDVTRVASNPGFLCRINDQPDPDTEACQAIPPASAHWAYWTAVAGGEWQLSRSGASGTVSGDYEGWSFSTGQPVPPRYTIPQDTTTTTSTTTTTTTTTSSTTSTTTTTPPVDVTQAPATTTSSTTVPVTAATSAPDDSRAVPPPTSHPTETTSTTSEPVLAGPTVDPPAGSAGGQTGTLLAVLVIAVGGAGAWLVSWLRRRGTDT